MDKAHRLFNRFHRVGKTTMALQFAIEGTRHGVRSMYVNLQEIPIN